MDEETRNITASIVNRKGVLQVGDSFVCGYTEGKVKFILEDGGKSQLKFLEELSDLGKITDLESRKLFPGQSGRIGGFRELPDAGYPLYKVENPLEAKFLTNLRTKRKEKAENEAKGTVVLDKKLLNIDWREKRKLYSGDKTAILSQLDLLDEEDVQKMEGMLKHEEKIQKRGVTRVHKSKSLC